MCIYPLVLRVSQARCERQLDEHFLAIAVEAAALPAALHRHSEQQHPQPPCAVVCLATCCVCDACRTARTAQHIGSMRRGTVATGSNAAPLQNVRRSVTVCRCERTEEDEA